MITIINFISDILGISGRYDFIIGITAAMFALILLDGIIAFFISGLTALTSRR